MKNNYKKIKSIYDNILNIISDNREFVKYDLDELQRIADNHLCTLELIEVYGLNIEDNIIIYNKKYQELKNNVYIVYIDGINSKITWEDNGKMPKGESLIMFSYSNGAYMFGNDYPIDIFMQFFLELKSYNPDYIDSNNKSLYFKLENAKKIFNNYDTIIKKYVELNKKDSLDREIRRKKIELEELLKKELEQHLSKK